MSSHVVGTVLGAFLLHWWGSDQSAAERRSLRELSFRKDDSLYVALLDASVRRSLTQFLIWAPAMEARCIRLLKGGEC